MCTLKPKCGTCTYDEDAEEAGGEHRHAVHGCARDQHAVEDEVTQPELDRLVIVLIVVIFLLVISVLVTLNCYFGGFSLGCAC